MNDPAKPHGGNEKGHAGENLDEKQFRQMVDHSPIGMAIVSLDGGFIRVNPALCEIVGYSRDELSKLTFQQITVAEDLDTDLQLMRDLLDGKIPFYQMDKRYVRKDGSRIWVQLNATLLRDERGAPIHFLAQVQNISERKSSQERLQILARRDELALKAGEIGIWEWDLVSGELVWDRQMYEIYGVPFGKPVEYADWRKILVKEDLEAVEPELIKSLNEGVPTDLQFRIRHPALGIRYIEAAETVIQDSNGKAIRMVGVNRDVTEKHLAQSRLQESEERFRLMVDSIVDYAVVMLDPDGQIKSWNAGAEKIIGFDPSEILGSHYSKLLLEEGENSSQALMELDLARANGRFEDEDWRLRKDGTRYWANVVISAVRDERGTLHGFCKVIRDLSERRQSEEKLEQLAHFDPLTGLSNRTRLAQEADRLLAGAARSGSKAAVLFIDLDHFKDVNDALGHAAGDELLRRISESLKQSVRSEDCVGRHGGDEFVILLGNIADTQDVTRVAEVIFNRLRKPLQIADTRIDAGLSIGASIYPDDGITREVLFQCADSALYHAKAEGRNQLQFYRPQLTIALRERSAIEHDLRLAIENKELWLHLQPIVDLCRNEVVSQEALLRWSHPRRGVLMPDQFIAVAENSGLIVPIGEWVINAACCLIGESRPQIAKYISVNLSPLQFKSDSLVRTVRDSLRQYALKGGQLCLEITEACLLQDTDRTLCILDELRGLGVRIAIDDFGIGYSSFRYIKRLMPDVIKIDRSFINELTLNAEDSAIVRAVIALAKSLKIDVVAEGIETASQLAFLIDEGCCFGQGFIFGDGRFGKAPGARHGAGRLLQ